MSRERPPLDPQIREAAQSALASGLADVIMYLHPRRGLQVNPMIEFARSYAAMLIWQSEIERMNGRVDGKIIARAIDRVFEEHPPDPILTRVDDPEDPEDVDLDK
jgi:hypothetical protein